MDDAERREELLQIFRESLHPEQMRTAQGISLGGKSLCTAYCFPAFIKLRWREGELLDAKTYLIAGLQ